VSNEEDEFENTFSIVEFRTKKTFKIHVLKVMRKIAPLELSEELNAPLKP
jgi:ribosomal protein L7/L12